MVYCTVEQQEATMHCIRDECEDVEVLPGKSRQWVDLGRIKIQYEIPSENCPKCGEEYVSWEDWHIIDAAIAHHCLQLEYITGPVFKFIRKHCSQTIDDTAKHLGMSRKELEAIEASMAQVEYPVYLYLLQLSQDKLRDTLAKQTDDHRILQVEDVE